MAQFAILLAAVGETAMVHHFAGKGNVPKALAIDRTCRFLFPFVVYPWIIGCMLLIGFGAVILGIVLMALGLVCLALMGAWIVYWQLETARRKKAAQKKKVTDDLLNLDLFGALQPECLADRGGICYE